MGRIRIFWATCWQNSGFLHYSRMKFTFFNQFSDEITFHERNSRFSCNSWIKFVFFLWFLDEIFVSRAIFGQNLFFSRDLWTKFAFLSDFFSLEIFVFPVILCRNTKFLCVLLSKYAFFYTNLCWYAHFYAIFLEVFWPIFAVFSRFFDEICTFFSYFFVKFAFFRGPTIFRVFSAELWLN